MTEAMPIKLEDLTCERCIYSAPSTHPSPTVMGSIECRRRSQSTRTILMNNFWCGEGEWVMVAKGEHTSLLSVYNRRELLYNYDLTYEWPEQ